MLMLYILSFNFRMIILKSGPHGHQKAKQNQQDTQDPIQVPVKFFAHTLPEPGGNTGQQTPPASGSQEDSRDYLRPLRRCGHLPDPLGGERQQKRQNGGRVGDGDGEGRRETGGNTVGRIMAAHSLNLLCLL